MNPNRVELILHPRWIAPVVPEDALLENHSVAINDGRIVALAPRDDLAGRYNAAREQELPEHLLIPGLVNAHGHAAMSLLRGYADDKPLMEWLQNHIWPAEAKWIGEEFVRDGAELACAEMIRGGTTCFSDMYFFPEQTASIANRAGMRCQLVFPILDFPSAWARDGREYLHKGLALYDQYKEHPLIAIGLGPHAPYTVADDLLDEVAKYAVELDAPIQIHLHETVFEVEEAVRQSGQRPIERLRDRGILGPRTQCVHVTQASDSDIDLLATWNCHVVHCPESNLKLASGFCPVARLQAAGVNVAIGTDSAASNNDLDLLGETRTAALLAKAVAGDAAALGAHAALRMATLQGARALGLDDLIGSIEPGKSADLAAFDLSGLGCAPLYHPVSQLIYATPASACSHSWVAGRPLLDGGELATLDAEAIAIRTRHWAETLRSN